MFTGFNIDVFELISEKKFTKILELSVAYIEKNSVAELRDDLNLELAIDVGQRLAHANTFTMKLDTMKLFEDTKYESVMSKYVKDTKYFDYIFNRFISKDFDLKWLRSCGIFRDSDEIDEKFEQEHIEFFLDKICTLYKEGIDIDYQNRNFEFAFYFNLICLYPSKKRTKLISNRIKQHIERTERIQARGRSKTYILEFLIGVLHFICDDYSYQFCKEIFFDMKHKFRPKVYQICISLFYQHGTRESIELILGKGNLHRMYSKEIVFETLMNSKFAVVVFDGAIWTEDCDSYNVYYLNDFHISLCEVEEIIANYQFMEDMISFDEISSWFNGSDECEDNFSITEPVADLCPIDLMGLERVFIDDIFFHKSITDIKRNNIKERCQKNKQIKICSFKEKISEWRFTNDDLRSIMYFEWDYHYENSEIWFEYDFII
jgi:hypothetical protein